MQRLSGDTGAVGVMVALLMVPLLAFAALVVDIGADYLQKRQLQNAADAGALAVAQDCARGDCGNISLTATSLATANVRSGTGTTATSVLSGNTVTVTASSVVNYSFAPVIGIKTKTVKARSSASWGSPSGGTGILPLAFSWCSFKAQTNTGGVPVPTTTSLTILLTKGAADLFPCTGPSGNLVPGGFGWLQADGTGCTSTSGISVAQTPSDPGRSVPSICRAADFTAQQNKTVLLPIFDTFGSSGSGAWYHIYAYAAFKITGYNFGGQYKWNAPCTGSNSCISGYFSVLVEPSEAFTYGSGNPDLGARIVKLTA